MILDFPEDDIPDRLAHLHYEMVMKLHMGEVMTHLKNDISYFIYLGIFSAVSIWLLPSGGVVRFSSHLLVVIVMGFGMLPALLFKILCVSKQLMFNKLAMPKDGF